MKDNDTNKLGMLYEAVVGPSQFRRRPGGGFSSVYKQQDKQQDTQQAYVSKLDPIIDLLERLMDEHMEYNAAYEMIKSEIKRIPPTKLPNESKVKILQAIHGISNLSVLKDKLLELKDSYESGNWAAQAIKSARYR